MPIPMITLPSPFDSLYAELQLYGSGAEAEVFAARYVPTGQRVAVKVLKPSPGSAAARERREKRFVHEAARLREITHAHVARVFELLEVELRGEPTKAFVMEWLPATFRDHVARHADGLPLGELQSYLRQALEGLGALHEAGVAVRDLRPENLLLSEKGQLKLADLGLARTGESAPTLVESSRYQAPEVLDRTVREGHDRVADPPPAAYFASDVYSLGMIFYEAAVGAERWERLPQLSRVYGAEGLGSGLDPNQRWREWHLDRGSFLPPARSVRKELPEPLARALDGMVKKGRTERLGSVEAALTELGGAAAAAGAKDVAPFREQAREGEAEKARRPANWKKWLLAGGIVTALAVASLAIWSARSVRPSQPSVSGGTPALEATGIPAAPKRHVTDLPDVLSAGEEEALDQRLVELDRSGLTQMVVYVDSTLAGQQINDFGLRAFNAWGVGDKQKMNGLAVFVFINDRTVRIQVGRGLESVITDEFAAAVIRDRIVPNFRQQRYAAGLNEAVESLVQRLQNPLGAVPEPKAKPVARPREQATGTIQVTVEPAGLAAPWRLRGPEGYQREGRGSLLMEGRAAGSYTLTWLAAAGHRTPSPASRSRDLAAGGEIEFEGRYEVAGAQEEPVRDTTDSGRAPAAGTLREFTVGGLRLPFRWIPAGRGKIGSPAFEPCRDDDETQYTAVISNGFWLQETEVTQAQWTAVMGSNPSFFKDCADCPVEQVSWDDAQQFLQRLNGQGQGHFRLPTEAEWEYAARAGSAEPFGAPCADYSASNCSGTVPCLDRLGWYGGNSGQKTHPVGMKQANRWGLYDMVGNVWEWVADWYGSYPSGEVTNPVGPGNGSSRVLRGGSWSGNPYYCRVAYRSSYEPGYRYDDIGFRCVRDPD